MFSKKLTIIFVVVVVFTHVPVAMVVPPSRPTMVARGVVPVTAVIVVVVVSVSTAMLNGVLADQAPNGKHRFGGPATGTAAPATVAAVVGVASAAGTGPRT